MSTVIRTKLELLAAEWHAITQKLRGHENALAEHVKSDYETVKARYEAAVEHFKEQLAHVESKLPEITLKHIKNGAATDYAIGRYLNPPVAELPAVVEPLPKDTVASVTK